MPCSNVPNPEEAIQLYNLNGGNITDESDVGFDLLCNRADLQQIRYNQFWQELQNAYGNNVTSFLFSCTVNFNFVPLQNAILRHIHLSENLYFS